MQYRRETNLWLTEFVEDERVGLNSLAELVRLAGDHDGHVHRLGNHGDLRRPDGRHDAAVRQQTVSA